MQANNKNTKCKSFFKSKEDKELKKEFNNKWIKIINRMIKAAN